MNSRQIFQAILRTLTKISTREVVKESPASNCSTNRSKLISGSAIEPSSLDLLIAPVLKTRGYLQFKQDKISKQHVHKAFEFGLEHLVVVARSPVFG